MSFHFVGLVDLWVWRSRARRLEKRGETDAANCIRFAAQSGLRLVTEKLPFRNTAGAQKVDPEKTPIDFYTKIAKITKIDPKQICRSLSFWG